MIEFIMIFVYLWISILVHEFGHYAVARWFGLPINETQIGTGPKMFGFYRRGAYVSFNVFPTGGYVNLTFTAAQRWKRLLLYVAGPVMNLVFAGAALIFEHDLLFKINMMLAVFNLFPFKGFDGGQIMDDLRGRSKFRKAFKV